MKIDELLFNQIALVVQNTMADPKDLGKLYDTANKIYKAMESTVAEGWNECDVARNQREDVHAYHDACIKELYRMLNIDGGDGEYRFKWVALELSKVLSHYEKLKVENEKLKTEKNLPTSHVGVREVTKFYYINIDRRKDRGSIVGTFLSHEAALAALKDMVVNAYGQAGVDDYIAKFGGDLEKGEFYTEDETYTVKTMNHL